MKSTMFRFVNVFLAIFVLFCMFMGCARNNPADYGDNNTIIPSILNLATVAPLDSIKSLPVGTKMMMRTTVNGIKPEDFEVKFMGIVNLVPPFSHIMLEASDPRLIAFGGLVAGMSGSPVIWHGKEVGLASLSFDGQTHAPYSFFATAMKDVLSSSFTTKLAFAAKTIAYQGRQVSPIAVPILATGLSAKMQEALAKKGSKLSFTNVTSAGVGEVPAYEMEAGSPIGVALLLGDEINLVGVGTVGLVDGNNVYAFGHPMMNFGRTGLPIVGAYIMAQISDIFAPFKFASTGKVVVGTIDSDYTSGISGVLGKKPEMIGISLDCSFPTKQVVLKHEVPMAIPDNYKGDYVAVGIFDPLFNRLNESSTLSLKAGVKIYFTNSDLIVDRKIIRSDRANSDSNLGFSAYYDFYNAWYEMQDQRFLQLAVSKVEYSANFVTADLEAEISEVRTPPIFTAGQSSEILVTLKTRTDERIIPIQIEIPDNFPSGTYDLSVSSGYQPWSDPTPKSLKDVIDRINEGSDSNKIFVNIQSQADTFNVHLSLSVDYDMTGDDKNSEIKIENANLPSDPADSSGVHSSVPENYSNPGAGKKGGIRITNKNLVLKK